MQDDERRAARAVVGRIGLDRRRVQHERVGLEARQLLLGRVDEERLREERVPGAVCDHADGQPVGGIGAREGIDHVEVLAFEKRRDVVAQSLESRLVGLLVHFAPPDPALAAGLPHDEFVIRRATGVPAGVDDERPAFREPTLVPLQRVGVEDRGRGMNVDETAGVDPVLAQIDPSLGSDRQCHAVLDGISYARCAPERR